MKRLFWLLSLLLAPAAMAESLPVPPMPPADPVVGEVAPVPDPDASAPISLSAEQPRVDVKLYRATPYDPGLGFAPGSRYRSSEDRKPIQTPGLSVSVPLR